MIRTFIRLLARSYQLARPHLVWNEESDFTSMSPLCVLVGKPLLKAQNHIFPSLSPNKIGGERERGGGFKVVFIAFRALKVSAMASA